jgi:hypothetical protein
MSAWLRPVPSKSATALGTNGVWPLAAVDVIPLDTVGVEMLKGKSSKPWWFGEEVAPPPDTRNRRTEPVPPVEARAGSAILAQL